MTQLSITDVQGFVDVRGMRRVKTIPPFGVFAWRIENVVVAGEAGQAPVARANKRLRVNLILGTGCAAGREETAKGDIRKTRQQNCGAPMSGRGARGEGELEGKGS